MKFVKFDIETCMPEIGLTVSWDRCSASLCFYLKNRMIILGVHWGDWK